jgi:glutathione-regulated potassium-efflux system ancillary protein KefC
MQTQEALAYTAIFLLTAVLAVPLAKRLGLGSVLGYLFGGIIIGPFVLKVVTDVNTILHFAEFGVVLMMFVIGLELEPKKLWKLRHTIFSYGGAQLVACALGISAMMFAYGFNWREGLVAAFALALSSTALALASIQERNLLHTPAGKAGFGILLFQDMAAVPMIALLPLLSVMQSSQHAQSTWISIGIGVAVMLIVVIGGRYLIRPILTVMARTGLREIFTAFALLLVIAIALLMEYIGLSMALGSFLAGVLLADSEYRHALEADIEPFKGILLGLFFIAVGMSVNFSLLFARPGLILSLVCVFLLIKILILLTLARFFNIAKPQRWLFAFLLSQGGEFAFVLLGGAAVLQVMNGQTASLLILVVALSMLATPLLLLFHDKVLAPHFLQLDTPADEPIEMQENPVIIAGFGRFGQIIGRLLYSQGLSVTVLDHDPEQINFLRQFGFKVFYGDASRLDVLEAAGLSHAKIVVVALDDMEESLRLIGEVKRDYPHVQVYARARNVAHVYKLMDLQVEAIERELFEASLNLGRRVLEGLGHDVYEARRIALTFRRHNLAFIEQVYPHSHDQAQMVSMAQQGREELEQMFIRDRRQREKEQRGWR